MQSLLFTRRVFLAGLTASVIVGDPQHAGAQSLPKVIVTKDPSCGCCSAWADHIRAAGFSIETRETSDINRFKVRQGVPRALFSCHTADVGGYVIEGHVPAQAIKRLLAERPQAKGLAVPGMPAGSPGMDVEGIAPDTYDVVLFGPLGVSTFARYRGGQVL